MVFKGVLESTSRVLSLLEKSLDFSKRNQSNLLSKKLFAN